LLTLGVKLSYNQRRSSLTNTPEGIMNESHHFTLIYSKMQEVLDADARREPQDAMVKIRHCGEVSREETDEMARLREMILETVSPDPVSYTTT